MGETLKIRYPTHYEVEHYASLQLIYFSPCPMCAGTLSASSTNAQGVYYYAQMYRFCRSCSWWAYGYTCSDVSEGEGWGSEDAIGQLVEFSVADPAAPLDVLLGYLKRQPRAVADIHHRKFEEAVAAIYKEVYGYEVILTKQTHDKGIDLYLFGGSDGISAVQVKHVKDPNTAIGIDALQRLVGASYPRGINAVHLVTNGRISSMARTEANLVAGRMSVELRDFKDIAAALSLLRTSAVDGPNESPNSCPLWRDVVSDMRGVVFTDSYRGAVEKHGGDYLE